MDKYYTLQEIVEITRFAKQTIYNKISSVKLQRGIHYIKPSRKKILFKQQAIEFLLEDPTNNPESIKKNDSEDIEHKRPLQSENCLMTQRYSRSKQKSAFNI